MAVDRKADHVGNHGGVYTDNDGMSRQFTYIDHDKKTKISTDKLTGKEKKALDDWMLDYKKSTINAILAMPAVSFRQSGNMFANDYTKIDTEKGEIVWDENVVRNALDINDDMRYVVFNATWKNTVAERHWFTELTHDEIIEGKWQELM